MVLIHMPKAVLLRERALRSSQEEVLTPSSDSYESGFMAQEQSEWFLRQWKRSHLRDTRRAKRGNRIWADLRVAQAKS